MLRIPLLPFRVRVLLLLFLFRRFPLVSPSAIPPPPIPSIHLILAAAFWAALDEALTPQVPFSVLPQAFLFHRLTSFSQDNQPLSLYLSVLSIFRSLPRRRRSFWWWRAGAVTDFPNFGNSSRAAFSVPAAAGSGLLLFYDLFNFTISSTWVLLDVLCEATLIAFLFPVSYGLPIYFPFCRWIDPFPLSRSFFFF